MKNKEKKIHLTESELRKVVTRSYVQWFVLTVLVYLICAGVGFILSLFLLKVIAKGGL